jgi:putative nucleotidyltransferase with HDIG domain
MDIPTAGFFIPEAVSGRGRQSYSVMLPAAKPERIVVMDTEKNDICPAREKIQRITSLPSLAVIKYQLVKILNKDDASVEDISNIIEHDQALASKIIAIANSAFLGYPGRIGAIEQAVMLLGFDLVRSIALATSIFNVLESRYGNLKHIWAHSYVVAIIAGALCEKIPGNNKSSCYLGGLLHDIGRLVLFSVVVEGAPDGRMRELVYLRGDELLKEEETVCGCSHPQAAKWFLEYLCFPEEIIAPIETHHRQPVDGLPNSFSNVIFLAEGLAGIICPNMEHDGEWADGHQALFSQLGLKDADMDCLRASVEKEQTAISEFFDL